MQVMPCDIQCRTTTELGYQKCWVRKQEKVCKITETNLDISTEDFDYELDKAHRLPPNKKSLDKKRQHL